MAISTPLPAAPTRPALAPRKPLPQIICGTGRTAEQVAVELSNALAMQPQALVSHVEPEMYAAVRKQVPGVQYHARAKMLAAKSSSPDVGSRKRLPGTVAVVSAAPADLPVADQARLAADYMGCYAFTATDMTTANMARLIEQASAVQAADVVIVVAGADPALPAAIAGLVDAPVVAVPTSTGAASPMGGLGALAGAAACASSGVTLVGVDSGIGAAAVAGRVLAMAARRVQMLAESHAAQHKAASVAA